MSLAKANRIPVGSIVYKGEIPGIVVKSMRRFLGAYVVWGAQSLAEALLSEQQGNPAEFFAVQL